MESAELIAILREVRDRVRARNPETRGGRRSEIPLPDLMPLVHARDAAHGQSGGDRHGESAAGRHRQLAGAGLEAAVARVLDWHVREQVEFNRKIVACVDAAIEALNETNRALVGAGQLATDAGAGAASARNCRTSAATGPTGALDWERKLAQNEIQFLRSVADLQGGFQHRADPDGRQLPRRRARAAHRVHGALERSAPEIQQRLWADLERIRLEYERLIHSELRTDPAARGDRARQADRGSERRDAGRAPAGRSAGASITAASPSASAARRNTSRPASSSTCRTSQDCGNVLDIGCGRGEFLEMMRDAGVPARGIDLSEESVAICRHKGLDAEVADLFEYLADLPEASLDGIFCSQVVEHLPPERLPEMIKLAASRLSRNGVIAIETPNPECLAIFATHFYLDPTHTRPVPHPLLAFYLEEFGIGKIEVKRLAPAAESMPSLQSLPQDFRDAFFGGLITRSWAESFKIRIWGLLTVTTGRITRVSPWGRGCRRSAASRSFGASEN